MNRIELIEKLDAIRGGEWGNGMGMNDVCDFVDVSVNVETDYELMDRLRTAVENRICETLNQSADNVDPDTLGPDETCKNRAWELWCNNDLSANFDDIQQWIDDYV